MLGIFGTENSKGDKSRRIVLKFLNYDQLCKTPLLRIVWDFAPSTTIFLYDRPDNSANILLDSIFSKKKKNRYFAVTYFLFPK